MKIVKMLILLIGSILLVLLSVFFELKSISVGTMLSTLFAGILIPYLIPSIIDLTDNKNWKSSQRKLMRAGLLQKDTIIRISFAYLFRIKVDGKYFLVQNTRTKKYQPVGGAYKLNENERIYLSDNIPFENDDRIEVNKITKLDYRLLIKNKHLRKFVKRFNQTNDRENFFDLSREFIEEIFSTNILQKNIFRQLSYKYIGRHMTKVEYGNVFNHYELLLADIIEVQLSEQQEELFRELMQMKSNKYIFATANQIKSLGVEYGTDQLKDNIANHTPKILSENTENLIERTKYKDVIKISL